MLDAAAPRYPPERLSAAGLSGVLRESLPGRRFVVVSNREPYEHYWDEAADDTAVRRPAGGLVAALDPLMQAVGGIWIAWGSGDRDEQTTDPGGRVSVPPEDPSYSLRRLWLNQRDVNHYYHGYANQLLWPLCHLRPALTRTRVKYWESYESVNRRFAEAVLDELRDVPAGGGAVWFQDYHLALAPAVVRERRPDLALAHFWHIPFPPPDVFRIASHAAHLVRGLLANDLIGFHVPQFCENFIRCATGLVPEAEAVGTGAVRVGEHTCHVRSLPISIDIEQFREAAQQPGAEERLKRLRSRYAPDDRLLGVGVDRIDYSKGLEEKVKALDMLFESVPEMRERFTFVQVAVPSRIGIDAYDWLNEKLERAVWSLNDKWGTASWQPMHLVKENMSQDRLALFYRAADLCLITSLQDGMNLVAKEFLACQVDDRCGVLVLSEFAGAAQELDGAFLINPYDPEATAAALRTVLTMTDAERRERMRRMQGSLRNIYDWMSEVFSIWGAAARGSAVPLSTADGWSPAR